MHESMVIKTRLSEIFRVPFVAGKVNNHPPIYHVAMFLYIGARSQEGTVALCKVGSPDDVTR